LKRKSVSKKIRKKVFTWIKNKNKNLKEPENNSRLKKMPFKKFNNPKSQQKKAKNSWKSKRKNNKNSKRNNNTVSWEMIAFISKESKVNLDRLFAPS
jgi:hypothetical protein